jgi:serine/threonine protein kinase
MINTTIGKYKITRLIGEGGMASVYEAEHEMLGTKVAIKVLNPMLSANAQIKERFRNEAKLMASLDHPNITKVIDFDEQPQQLSIVIEYLNGEDLNQNIKRNGPLSEKEITDVFSQTLSAFQYAHEKGIVHRDIKPSNIFILPNGHVKILDFGIAKLFGQGNEMTHTGTQMGTPIYMSPEQVKADKSIDHRSDIYSLGVTLFFVINGKPPYNSDTDSQFDIFNKIVYEPLPEFSIQSKFKDIVLKACQKNREFRYQGCDDILSELNLKGIIKSDEKTIVNNTSKSHLQHDKTVLAKRSINNYDNQSAHPKAKKEPIGEGENSEKVLLSLGVAAALIGIILFGLSDGAEEGSVNGVFEQVQAPEEPEVPLDPLVPDIPEFPEVPDDPLVPINAENRNSNKLNESSNSSASSKTNKPKQNDTWFIYHRMCSKNGKFYVTEGKEAAYCTGCSLEYYLIWTGGTDILTGKPHVLDYIETERSQILHMEERYDFDF